MAIKDNVSHKDRRQLPSLAGEPASLSRTSREASGSWKGRAGPTGLGGWRAERPDIQKGFYLLPGWDHHGEGGGGLVPICQLAGQGRYGSQAQDAERQAALLISPIPTEKQSLSANVKLL